MLYYLLNAKLKWRAFAEVTDYFRWVKLQIREFQMICTGGVR